MIPTMSVFTVVHRALLWKRRTSLKGKGPDLDISLDEKSPFSDSIPHDHESVHRDVRGVQIAVRADAPSPPASDNIPDLVSDSSSGRRSCSVKARLKRDRLVRGVSWASIVRSQCRWTVEQERELVRAQRQLGKCQKAWSSEQEVWLSYVQALSEEKEAHIGFMSMRHRQQDDEQHQFRKAWKRRRSSSGDDEVQQSAIETANRLGKLRRLPRYGYPGQRLGATGSTVVAVEG
ncbi:hypothetical protein N7457_000540 [Penicillium paradoxum]|uniref:uncharacterized protein n=1 Tax=Penicillium paradoxum TaxID=176176 RepID=UPI002548AC2B|nr:uncharacterized protein N7457_000540 [Penicillium paradoxum]KAJ5793941.1 hypothetical protein N7457_000540 [Penicillium paradoxum]